MRRNVAGQFIGAQLNSTSTGAAVTSGTTTVYVTGGGGTQNAGGGTVTHKGNGYWSYAPTQAETDFDHVAFTFTNATAIAATVQAWPSFPQTGDAFARLGAPAGASIAADIATRLATASYTAPLDAAGTAGAVWNAATASYGSAGSYGLLVEANLDTNVGSRLSTAGYTAPDNAGITTLTGRLTAGRATNLDNLDATVSSRLATAGYTAPLSAAGTRTAVGLAAADLDAQLGTLATAANLATVAGYVDTEVAAIKAKTDQLTFTVAGQVDANVQYVNDVQVVGTGASGDEWGPV